MSHSSIGQDLQFAPKTFVPALLHQLSRTGSPIHTEDFRSSAAPPTVKDRFSNSHRRLSFQRCSTNCQGQVLQFTPKTFVPALLHQLSRTGIQPKTRSGAAPNCQGQVPPKTFVPALLHQLSRTIHTEDFRSSAAPPIVKDTQFTPKTFVPALLHQLSRTGSPIHTEDFRSSAAPPTVKTGSPIHTEDFRPSAAPPTVKDRFSNSHRRLSLQRCSTNCQGQVLQFTPKTFAPALLHRLSRTGSPIHTEDSRSSAAPPTVKDRFSNSHRRLSFQRCSTDCQGQVLQFTPKTFAAALLHQLSRTGSPIHTEDFRSSAAPPTVKDRFSNSHRRLSQQRCSTNCQEQDLQFTPKTFVPALFHQLSRAGSPIHTEDFRCSAAPPTVKDRISNLHRRLSFSAAPPTVKDRMSKFTSKTFVPALLHQLSRTGSPIHTEDFGSSAAPPTVKDKFSNSHRRLWFRCCSTKCQGQDLQFTPKTFVPALLHPQFKDRFPNSHRRLSLQRCSTNCQRQVLQFTPKTFVPALLHQLSRQVLQFTPKTFVPALLHQLSRTGSPIRTEDFRSSAAPPTVKDRFSNSHRRLSFQRCSTNCQGHVLQFTPKTLVPALLHELSRTGSPIQPKTFVPALLHQLSRTGSPIHTEDFRSSAAPPIVKDRISNSHRRLSFQRISNSHRRLSFQRCSTNFQRQILQLTTKTFAPALLHQLSRTGSPIHTKNFRSSAAPPTVKNRFSNSHRRLSLQRCSTNCRGQVLKLTLEILAPALLHQLSRTGSPIHTEDFRSSAAPPTVMHRFSKSHRRLSLQRCSTNCQGQFRSSAAPRTVKDKFSNSHRKLSFQRCSTNCQGQILQF